jgi:hypothetical protein
MRREPKGDSQPRYRRGFNPLLRFHAASHFFGNGVIVTPFRFARNSHMAPPVWDKSLSCDPSGGRAAI